jgi:hypothetical protein
MSENDTIEHDEIIPPEPTDLGGPDITSAEAVVFEPDTFAERTVAFFADPRATSLLLAETVQRLIESLDIQRGIVDITTVVGVAIARVLRDEGVPFDVLEFGQESHYRDGAADSLLAVTPETADTRMMAPVMRVIAAGVIANEAGRLRQDAAGIREMPIGELGLIDANVVLIPAMVGPDEKLLDFTVGSLLGTVIGQLEEAERDFVLIGAPERGLRAMPDGSYQREVAHVRASNPGE